MSTRLSLHRPEEALDNVSIWWRNLEAPGTLQQLLNQERLFPGSTSFRAHASGLAPPFGISTSRLFFQISGNQNQERWDGSAPPHPIPLPHPDPSTPFSQGLLGITAVQTSYRPPKCRNGCSHFKLSSRKPDRLLFIPPSSRFICTEGKEALDTSTSLPG